MLNRFKQFYDIVKNYDDDKIYSCKFQTERDDLLTEYKQWNSDMSTYIQSMSAEDFLDYKRSVLLAYDGHKAMSDKYSNKMNNCIAIAIGAVIAIFVGFVQMIPDGYEFLVPIITIIIVAVAAGATWFLRKDLRQRYNDHFSKFLYYSAILSILNTMENEETITNTDAINKSTTEIEDSAENKDMTEISKTIQ